jgi:hypothetical protein
MPYCFPQILADIGGFWWFFTKKRVLKGSKSYQETCFHQYFNVKPSHFDGKGVFCIKPYGPKVDIMT